MQLESDLILLDTLFSDEAEEPIITCMQQELRLARHIKEHYGDSKYKQFQTICDLAFVAHRDFVNSRGTLNRMGGHPYYTHCVNVAYALKNLTTQRANS